MKTYQSLLFLALILLLASCDDAIVKPGDDTVETRALTDFTKLEVNGCIDVTFQVSEVFEVEIEAGENHIDFVDTDVVGDWLIIDERLVNIGNNDIRAFVRAPNLDEILLNGSGDIDAANLDAETIEVRVVGSGDINVDALSDFMVASVSGSGDITISGDTGDLDLTVKGSGDINARNIVCDIAEVHVKGSGDVKVNVLQELFASISGSGDIHYWGNPEIVNTNVSGSGDILEH